MLEMETRCRDLLDEPSAGQWTSTQLRRWMSEGNKELAKVTRGYVRRRTIALVAGQSEYVLPPEVLAVNHAYFVDVVSGTGSRQRPLIARHWENMDILWSEHQDLEGAYPQAFTVWGASPDLTLRVYPVPSISGDELRCMCPVLPDDLTSADGDTADIRTGYEDAVVEYAVYMAKRKDRDPTWQEAWSAFAGKRDELIHAGDALMVNRELVPDPMTTAQYVPWWIAEF